MGKVNAKLFSLKNGYESIDDLKAIKIKSKDYNLLIMEDYLPVIGKIEGTLTLIKEEESKEYKNISGFYRHSNNQFEILIED